MPILRKEKGVWGIMGGIEWRGVLEGGKGSLFDAELMSDDVPHSMQVTARDARRLRRMVCQQHADVQLVHNTETPESRINA